MTILGNTDKEALNKVCKEFDLDSKNMPRHVAVIMDGNGRWAKKRLLPRVMGHKEGAEALRRTIKACSELNIHYVSVYAFSTENWKRPKAEVEFLMTLLEELTQKETPKLKAENVRVKYLGDLEELSPKLQKSFVWAEEETKECTKIQVNLMINYGSRREITHAVKKIAKKFKNNELDTITEDTISEHLYTQDIPDPEILIRTSNEHRISNYLLWQLSYAEFFFIPTLWPDFSRTHLFNIIKQYQTRDRRFGGLSE